MTDRRDTPFTIRTALATDLTELQRVFRAASLSNPDDAPRLLAAPEHLLFAGDGVAAGRTRVAVAEGGDLEHRVLGFATVVDGPDGDPELDDLFTDPEERRRGIARGLVHDAVRAALAGGHGRMWVTGNPHALAFYRSVGFVDVGEAVTALGTAPRLRLDLTPP